LRSQTDTESPTAALLHQRRRRGICDREDESHPSLWAKQALYWRDRSQLETGKGWETRGEGVRSLGAVVQEYTSERLRRVKCRGLAPIFNRFDIVQSYPGWLPMHTAWEEHPSAASTWRPAPYGTVSLHEASMVYPQIVSTDVNYFICKIRFLPRHVARRMPHTSVNAGVSMARSSDSSSSSPSVCSCAARRRDQQATHGYRIGLLVPASSPCSRPLVDASGRAA